MPEFKRFKIRQLSPVIGAIIDGVDLSNDIDEETIEEIKTALVTYLVIFFEKQNLTPKRQRDFAKRFGELHCFPLYLSPPQVPEIIVFDHHGDNRPSTNIWHTDFSSIPTPPMGSILTAKMVPPCGGDTIWSSNIAAYDTLSEPMQKLLDGLTAVHDYAKVLTASKIAGGDEEKFRETLRKNPPTTHPVVRVHPVTGKKGLFVNSCYTTRINELTKGESDTLLEYLYSHTSKPEFTVRWKWSVGDVAFWDNRLTQHYALADYMPHRRIMHRATVLGCRPKGPN